jgi:hypothetical protein
VSSRSEEKEKLQFMSRRGFAIGRTADLDSLIANIIKRMDTIKNDQTSCPHRLRALNAKVPNWTG